MEQAPVSCIPNAKMLKTKKIIDEAKEIQNPELDLADKGIASFEEMPGLCEYSCNVSWKWCMTKFGNLFDCHSLLDASMCGGVAQILGNTPFDVSPILVRVPPLPHPSSFNSTLITWPQYEM